MTGTKAFYFVFVETDESGNVVSKTLFEEFSDHQYSALHMVHEEIGPDRGRNAGSIIKVATVEDLVEFVKLGKRS